MIKKIISVIVLLGILIGIIALVVTIAKNDKEKVSSLKFERGAINEQTGEHIKTKTSVYTPNAIECKGLEVIPNFNAGVRYQIFWYNEDELYFGCTAKTTSGSEKFLNEVPALAKYCRIVLYPYDEKGQQSNDDIKFYSVNTLANKVSIKVDKKQDYDASDLYELAGLKPITEAPATLTAGTFYLDGYHYVGFDTSNNNVSYTSYNAAHFSKQTVNDYSVIKIDCSGVKEYVFKYDDYDSTAMQHTFFFDANGKNIMDSDKAAYVDRKNPSPDGSYRIKVPNGAVYMLINVMDDVNGFEINEYLPRNTVTENLYK